MIKRFFLCFLYSLFIFSIVNISFAAGTNEQSIKKVISVVYDDSYSMTKSIPFPDKQDDQYAMYALENVIGFTNNNDEVNIVRMSKKNDYKTYKVGNISEKKESIAEVASWNTYASETPFQAVETGISFLKEKKEQYETADNVEYWLLVLTDGDLEGKPTDVVEYFNNVKDDMSDVKYESVWIFIGSDIRKDFPDRLKSIQGVNVIFSGNDQEICEAVYDACEIIYGRTSLKKNKLNVSGSGETVKFNFDFPVNKVIVYEQDQNVDLKRISAADGKTYTSFTNIETEKKQAPSIKSKIIQMDGNNVLPSGEIELEFDSAVDVSENKFMVMVDIALDLRLCYVSKDGAVTNEGTNEFGDLENVNFVSQVINLYDGSSYNLSQYLSNVTSSYYYDGKVNKMSFDASDNNYKFTNTVKSGNNSFIAELDYPGFFRLKSQPLGIYVPSIPILKKITPIITPDTINVSKKFDDYEKVAEENIVFEGLTSDEKIALEFTGIPKGIQLKINGSVVKNNKITTNVKGSQKLIIDVYRNRDYKGNGISNVEIFTKFKENSINDRLSNSNISFSIGPKERNIVLDISKLNEIDPNDMTSDKAYGKNLYYVKPMIDGVNISKEELKNSKISFTTDAGKTKSSVKYKIVDNNNENGFYIYLKAPFNKLDCAESFILTTNLSTYFNEAVSSDKLRNSSEAVTVRIKLNPLPFIISVIAAIAFIWWIIGMIKKPKFEKTNHKIIVLKDGTEISNAPIRLNGGFASLVPYKPQTGQAYDLLVIASDSQKAIYVDKKSLKEGMVYDGEILMPPFKKNLKVKEDTPLVYSSNGEKIIYTYTNVRVNGNYGQSNNMGFGGDYGGQKTNVIGKQNNSSSSGGFGTVESGPWG